MAGLHKLSRGGKGKLAPKAGDTAHIPSPGKWSRRFAKIEERGLLVDSLEELRPHCDPRFLSLYRDKDVGFSFLSITNLEAARPPTSGGSSRVEWGQTEIRCGLNEHRKEERERERLRGRTRKGLEKSPRMNCLSARDEQKQFMENGSGVEHAIATPWESVGRWCGNVLATNHAHICKSHIAQHECRDVATGIPFLARWSSPFLSLRGHAASHLIAQSR